MGIDVQCEWKDQGFGDRTGSVWIRLIRGNKQVSECRHMFGECAHHEWTKVKCTLINTHLNNNAHPGDVIRVMRDAGPGNGDSRVLSVSELQLVVQYNLQSTSEQVTSKKMLE